MKVKVNLRGKERIEEMQTICHMPVLVDILKEKYNTEDFVIIEIQY